MDKVYIIYFFQILPPSLTPAAAITDADENHGYVIVPTALSLKDMYNRCVPSDEPHKASTFENISSIKKIDEFY